MKKNITLLFLFIIVAFLNSECVKAEVINCPVSMNVSSEGVFDNSYWINRGDKRYIVSNYSSEWQSNCNIPVNSNDFNKLEVTS